MSSIFRNIGRLSRAIIPEGVRRGITDFTNWLTGSVREEQVPQVLDEITSNLRRHYPRRYQPPPQPPRPPPIREPPRPWRPPQRRHTFELREEASAFRNFTTQHVIDGARGYGPIDFLEASRPSITTFLRNNRNIKVMLSFQCELQRYGGDYVIVERPFRSHHEINLRGTDVEELYDKMVERAMENLSKFTNEGSGWSFVRVISLTLYVTEYAPFTWFVVTFARRYK